MRIKKLLTGILTVMMACPAMAEVNVDITAGTNNPGCTNTVLHTYTGPTDLEADYTANTININFYSDENTVYSTGTCTYDGSITLPEEDPTRTGYTFDGWQVRRAAAPSQPQQTTFDLSSLFGPNDIRDVASKSGYSCSDGGRNENIDLYGLTHGSGEWAAEFSYGIVKGQSLCSSAQTGAPDETGSNCWCKITDFAEPNSNTYQNVSSSSWVFTSHFSAPDLCAHNCASVCAFAMEVADEQDEIALRCKVFGVYDAEKCYEEEDDDDEDL